MNKALQEQFKNYVFENIKANLDEWINGIKGYGELHYKLIELRRQYAKENGSQTVTQICPNLYDLESTVIEFREECIKREIDRIDAEYKPLAISKVVNDEDLKDRLNATLAKGFSEFHPHKGSSCDPVRIIFYELTDILKEHYDAIKQTLSTQVDVEKSLFYDLANEILTSLFTLQLVLKADNSEEFKKVA